MTKGFYFYRNKIYDGSYDAKQVSGWINASIVKPEMIQTKQPINQDDRAVKLWENHRLLDAEYTDLQAMLLKMNSFLELNQEQAPDFSLIEEKLEIPLPRELKLIYAAIHNQSQYFTCAQHFLPLEQIYVEQKIIVFFKKKRLPVAGYDIESGQLAYYYKREWIIDKSNFSCYQFCLSRILTIALENKPVFKKGRCKGKFVTTLNIQRELEHFCNEKYHLLSEFNVYGIAVMYSDEQLIAWIRSNGHYADIHAGANDEQQLEALRKHLGAITW